MRQDAAARRRGAPPCRSRRLRGRAHAWVRARSLAVPPREARRSSRASSSIARGYRSRDRSGVSPIPGSSTSAGSQAITTTLPGPAGHGADEAQHRLRVDGVRVDHLAVLDARGDSASLGLEHVERARRAAALAGDVEQDQRVVAAHHLVGEIEAARAEVLDCDAVRQLQLASAGARPRRRSRRPASRHCPRRRPGSAGCARSCRPP